MSYTADPRVDAYIDALPEWQQAICTEVRTLVHAADSEVIETIKLIGGFELPKESMLARYRRNLRKSIRFYRTRRDLLKGRDG